MPVKVVDASAAAAFLFAEPEASEIGERFADAKLLAPSLFGYELANICLKKLRSNPGNATLTLERYKRLGELRVEQCEADIAACLELARRFALTAYDSAYLWLSRDIGAELVTLDQKLARAAAAA